MSRDRYSESRKARTLDTGTAKLTFWASLTVRVVTPASVPSASNNGLGARYVVRMYQIRALQSGNIRIPTEGISLNSALDVLSGARRNKLKVIEGAYSIESKLVNIVAYYFQPDIRERRDQFREIVL